MSQPIGEARVGRRAEQKRRWDRDNRPPCVDCGAPRERAAERCRTCSLMHIRRHWPGIARLWRQGRTCREIAAELGLEVGSMTGIMAAMRKAGWDLPRRHNWTADGLRRAQTGGATTTIIAGMPAQTTEGETR